MAGIFGIERINTGVKPFHLKKALVMGADQHFEETVEMRIGISLGACNRSPSRFLDKNHRSGNK
jgi:hypothetical protein